MNTHHVSAESRITFDVDTMPTVTARHGMLTGCRFRLAGLTVTVSATTQADGQVRISTALRPEVESCRFNPGDEHLNHADYRLLTLDDEQLPAQCLPEWDALVATVHALHPSLRYTDSPLALSLAAVPA